MSERLTNIKNTIVSKSKSRLQQARESVKLDGEELKKVIFGDDNFNKHIKPTLDFINSHKDIFTQHNI